MTVKRWIKIYHEKTKYKEVCEAILMSETRISKNLMYIIDLQNIFL